MEGKLNNKNARHLLMVQKLQ